MAFTCPNCETSFVYEKRLDNHVRKGKCKKKGERFTCPDCPSQFERHYTLERHREMFHMENSQSLCFLCGICNHSFADAECLRQHKESHKMSCDEFDLKESAHNRQSEIVRLYLPPNVRTYDEAIQFSRERILRLIRDRMVSMKNFKIAFTFFVEMYKMHEGEIMAVDTYTFRSNNMVVYPLAEIEDEIEVLFNQIEQTIDAFLNLGSGWVVDDVLFVEAEIAKCRPLSGACGRHEVKYVREKAGQKGKVQLLPQGFTKEDTGDGRCFFLAVAHYFCKNNGGGSEEEFIASNMNTSVSAPVKVRSIKQFEEDNSALSLGINVIYQDEDGEILPVYATKRSEAQHKIVLLLSQVRSTREEGDCDCGHYTLLENPDALLRERKRDSSGKSRSIPQFTCYNCFSVMSTAEAYQNHIAFCHKLATQRIEMPKINTTVSFDDEQAQKKTFKIGYTLFYDFETLQKPPDKPCNCTDEMRRARDGMSSSESDQELNNELQMIWDAEEAELERDYKKIFNQRMDEEETAFECFYEEEEPEFRQTRSEKYESEEASEQRRFRSRKPKACKHKSAVLKEQPAFAFSYIMVDRHGKVVERFAYAGDDAAHVFVSKLLELETKYIDALKDVTPMKMTEAQVIAADAATHCWICEEAFKQDDVKYRDHDHISGEFIGMAHNTCNLHRREQLKIVAFAHNFSGYDSHLIVRELGKFGKDRVKVSAIPLNTQKFKSITINNKIILLDSMSFLSDSLGKLVDTLVKSEHDFPLMRQWVTDEEEMKLLLRKGVYPYAFATSIKRLKEQKTLPDKEEFTNDIGGEKVKDCDYAHAKNVWEKFKVGDMMDYTMLYVRSDVYQLAEAITHMRNAIYEEHEIDMCQYLSLPMLTKDLMLKMTGVEIELISDQEMACLIKENIRGGLSFINTRYFDLAELARASGKPKTAVYLDANNLYGKAMSMPLPLRDFAWMNKAELDEMSVNWNEMITEEEGPGYILEVDLEYPAKLHESHSSFPLAPHKRTITEKDLSPYSFKCLQEFTKSSKHSAEKLVATFEDREKYLVHGLNLKLYLQLGLRLKKIHRGIKFHQAPFIKEYIDKCTRKRAEAPTLSMKNIWKLKINALYGKMIESSDKRMDCRFNRGPGQAMRNTSNPLFKAFLICTEDLSISFHGKRVIKMNQMWAVGFAILELSKYVMQSLMYNVVKPRLGDVSTVMSDTDSWILLANKSSPDEVVGLLSDVMDFSNYCPDHEYFSESRKAWVGFLKNEVPNDSLSRFVGLRAKTYTFETSLQILHSRAKSISGVYRKKITFEEYLRCIQQLYQHVVKQVGIVSQNHVNKLIASERVAFSSFDDKRYLLCPVHSVPYGSIFIDHAKVTNTCMFCEDLNLLI